MDAQKTESRAQKLTLRLIRRRRIFLASIVVLASLAFNIWIATYLANDQSDDGKLYAQIASNLLEQGVFSAETQAPFTPTLIRLPGYPLFLAAVYSAFGNGNNTDVRIVQAIVYTAACVLAALVAWNWLAGNKRRRRKAAFAAFVFAAFCPFTVIFSATILTETLTMFFLAAMTLAATYAFKSKRRSRSIAWWAMTGLVAGIAVMLRPDSGLFALGIGLALLLSIFIIRPPERSRLSHLFQIFCNGLIFSAAFAIVLVPWTVRNERVFGTFQPLAPAHAEAPGEFVPHGYFLWVRTWIDDSRYIEPVLWNLEDKPINVEELPAYAFASDEEKLRVAALLDQYNRSDPEQQASEDQASDDESKNTEDESEDNNADNNSDVESDQSNADESLDLKMSPEVDAAFQQIADERIAREPLHFYVWLPAKRAISMWFNTHSDYYSFTGELFPLKDLDSENYQNLWLPLFGALTWLYTLLAFGGAVILWAHRDQRSRLWLVLAVLLGLPRIIFFGTLENPEPRYLVELFIIAAILGGIVLSRFRLRRRAGYFSFEFLYRGGG